MMESIESYDQTVGADQVSKGEGGDHRRTDDSDLRMPSKSKVKSNSSNGLK